MEQVGEREKEARGGERKSEREGMTGRDAGRAAGSGDEL